MKLKKSKIKRNLVVQKKKRQKRVNLFRMAFTAKKETIGRNSM
jgi:hypothetical protein